MRRETTNKIRFVLEDILPAILRDSFLFKWAARSVWGDHILRLSEFRKRAPFLTEKEYEALYRDHPRVHDETDCSLDCIKKISSDILGDSICDVGCGTGALLSTLLGDHQNLEQVTGVDFVIEDAAELDGIQFVVSRVEELPFKDNAFDTVICTHVIEHILDYRAAIKELRRVTKMRLIIVVPREREFIYTFNPHFNFFPYTHSFLRALIPVPDKFQCIDIHRDIYYCEDM